MAERPTPEPELRRRILRREHRRGGRPDLADDVLPDVTAPTLLIVGERDRAVLGLNRQAQQRLRAENRLEIVPGATHLFEEPGALDAVTQLARDWFTTHFAAPGSAAPGSPAPGGAAPGSAAPGGAAPGSARSSPGA